MADTRPIFISTVWFEGNGAKRHAACRAEFMPNERVRLTNLETGTLQIDVSTALFRTLVARGLVRPLDEVPTRLSNKQLDDATIAARATADPDPDS